ncbi:MAG: hypothetical protein HQK49_07205 [Oligoflexia bacterium]|nr:hypothetical protein [Oligoflexia bacterium]
MTEDTKKYQRKHLRAPLKTMILYEDDGYVFKAQLSNISKGGILIANLPNYPMINIIPIIIDIPEMPVIRSDDLSKLRLVNIKDCKRHILRTRVHTVRRAGATTSIGEIFAKNIGAAFVDQSMDLQITADKYISSFAYNITFLLRLLSISICDNEDETIEKIKVLCTILGYDPESKISTLTRQVTDDYRGLQWPTFMGSR